MGVTQTGRGKALADKAAAKPDLKRGRGARYMLVPRKRDGKIIGWEAVCIGRFFTPMYGYRGQGRTRDRAVSDLARVLGWHCNFYGTLLHSSKDAWDEVGLTMAERERRLNNVQRDAIEEDCK